MFICVYFSTLASNVSNWTPCGDFIVQIVLQKIDLTSPCPSFDPIHAHLQHETGKRWHGSHPEPLGNIRGKIQPTDTKTFRPPSGNKPESLSRVLHKPSKYSATKTQPCKAIQNTHLRLTGYPFFFFDTKEDHQRQEAPLAPSAYSTHQ